MCRLPYAGGKSSGIVTVPKPKATTLLAELQNAETRAKRNAEMLAERDAYMAKLAEQRRAGEEAEQRAAVKFQTLWRGFRARPHSDAVAALLEERAFRRAGARGEPSVVYAALRDLDEEVGLSPIPGVTLPKRTVTTEQRLAEEKLQQQEAHAAIKVQGRARILCARHDVLAIKDVFEEKARWEAALSFQALFRGGKVRQRQRAKLEDNAARVLQSFARSNNAFMKTQGLKLMVREKQREEEQQRKAAIKLQAIQRGTLSRKKPDHVKKAKKMGIQNRFSSLPDDPSRLKVEEDGGVDDETELEKKKKGGSPDSSAAEFV